MNKKMLIDTTHAEETRVVVMDGERLEDYDVETSARKQLKGNIYLAKVIRVEPSLQAAFVEYGGNRHGFLAFSEIHPDYFQIPVADREKLLAIQEEDARAEEQRLEHEDSEGGTTPPAENADASAEDGESRESSAPEMVGGENDTGDEGAAARRMARFLRNYKIQEVIRRRQIILVQVVKEERGNKGAALTTYISLAGRYCVLMPNALRGGGVSRKITSDSDRRRLRDIITGLDLPRGMAMIVRTAGAQRPGPEIIRDCEYLLQLWDDIRSHTLSSVAPALIYEEASLIKRAIRDLYSKDIEEIVIDGEPAWKNAREFMRLLMPHNVNKVKLWRDQAQSLFTRYHVEGHLDLMFSPTAQLRSGGYLVINQTEALVAIDVNSGRSTSQRNIEETALRTNLEAAEEVARQLRLRDLAGLIVIDFIDMESRKHNSMVEKRLKDALRSDRARIQIGTISHFGLLEMSRQRLRPSLAEAVLSPCPHCQGTGFVRGTESAALHILRAIDDEGTQQKAASIEAHVAPVVALYILNHKRAWLAEIEQRHRMEVVFKADDTLMPSDIHIERLTPQTAAAPRPQITAPVEVLAGPVEHEVEHAPTVLEPTEAVSESAVVAQEAALSREDEGREEGGRRRRRRRRGRRERRPENEMVAGTGAHAESLEDEAESEALSAHDDESVAAEPTSPAMVMPGRRRTRSRRIVRTDSAQETTPVHEEPTHTEPSARVERERRKESFQPPVWTGPTPADPFGGGSFDIFDVIEQAENAQEHLRSVRHVPISEGSPRKRETRPETRDVTPETEVVEDKAMIAPVEAPVEASPAPVELPAAATATPAPRRRGRPRKSEVVPTEAKATEPAADAAPETPAEEAAAGEAPVGEAPKKRGRKPAAAKATTTPAKRPSRRKAAESTPVTSAESSAPVEPIAEPAAEGAPKRRGRPRRKAAEATPAEDAAPAIVPIDVDEATPTKPRAGWWRR